MKIIETYLHAVKVIELDCHKDDRGYFMEIYNQSKFREIGINEVFIQDNCSYSLKAGTIRGLHFQNPPFAQAKLIRCTKGKILDISVDVRKGSPTFGKATVIELSEHDHKLVLIPHGFAHGVAVLEDESEYNYKVDCLFNKESESCLSYNYSMEELDWSKYLSGIEFHLSLKDKNNPTLEEMNTGFIFKED